MYPEKFLTIPLVRPALAEQQAILDVIADATGQMEGAMQTAHREIGLLREYRTRLIADVVTGKLDVRAAAASMPDEADEAQGLDDAEGVGEGEELEGEVASVEEAVDE